MDHLYHYTYYAYGYWNEIQDERTKSYPLVAVHPITMAGIMGAYFLAVTKIGPSWMKDRPAFQLRQLMIVYNITMVCVNAFFLFESVRRSNYGQRLLDFKYPDRSDVSSETLKEIHLGWWYWMSKFADWADTTFYVLRKKNASINFLHLYHHISVPVFGYLILKINPVLPSAHLFIIINCFIHVVMYGYYALSALGPSVQPYLWWKKYITVMQLAQFGIGMLYGLLVACFQTGYPPVWLYFGFTQPPFFFWMFYNFYQQAYKQKGGTAQIKSSESKAIKSQ